MLPAHLEQFTNPIPVGHLGFVRLVDVMGDDNAIVQAARVSYGAGTKSVSDDRALIRYLKRHRHTSPFEMCEIKLHLKLPIHVMRQLIRHRTANVNETSTRYSEVLDEFELFQPDGIRYQSTSNKQGSAGFVEEELGQTLSDLANEAIQQSYKTYEKLREHNVAREQARNVLPLATYTECYWKIDVHNLFHLLGLRLDGHAQLEIRQFGQAIVDIVKQWLPVAYEAFIDYQLEACYLSRQEKEVLSEVIRQYNLGTLVDQLLTDKGVSTRERNEIATKLNIEVTQVTQ